MKIIMNPPYKGSLHLEIVDQMLKTFPDAEIINISPIRWLQDITAESKLTSDWNVFADLREHIANLEVIDSRQSQRSFSADIPTDLGIYLITPEKGEWNDKSLWNPIAVKILDRIRKDNLLKPLESNKKDGWRIKISSIHGKGGYGHTSKVTWQKLIYFYEGKKDGKWWYNFYNRNQHTKTTEEITSSIKFDSEEEARNFIETTSSKLGRYYYNARCISMSINTDFYLWLPHYNKVWTDQELYEYFGLTDEEIQTVEDFFKDKK